VRTRLMADEADAAVLRLLGEHLGSLAGADLAVRCSQGRLDAGGRAASRKERKQTLTASSTSRWAGAITRASEDVWQLAERNLQAEARSLSARAGRIRRRLAVAVGDRRGRVRGYATEAERWQKQQRLQALSARLARAEARLAEGRVSVCRGGKRLARARHNLQAAGLDEDRWCRRWQASRWFITADGEKDKPWGNETIRWHPEQGWLEVKLPAAVAHLADRPHGRYRLSCPVAFPYRTQEVAAQAATGAVRYDISWDPRKDRWYLDASWTFPPQSQAGLDGLRQHPVLAVDLNVGHLAAWVIDQSGNPCGPPLTIPLGLEGLPSSTRDGHLRQAISKLIRLAKADGCRAVVIEDLDFQAARAEGREHSRRRPSRGRRGRTFRRLVGGIPTAKFRDRLVQMAANAGLAVIAVDPAYTSRWGAQHWLVLLSNQFSPDTTVHHSAAVVIGRRALGQRARRRERRDWTRPEDRRQRAANSAVRPTPAPAAGLSGRRKQEARNPPGPREARLWAQDPAGRTGIPEQPGRRRPFARPEATMRYSLPR